jgi:hypothetical protein
MSVPCKVRRWLQGKVVKGSGSDPVKEHVQHRREYDETVQEVEAAVRSESCRLLDYVDVTKRRVATKYTRMGQTASTSDRAAEWQVCE